MHHRRSAAPRAQIARLVTVAVVVAGLLVTPSAVFAADDSTGPVADTESAAVTGQDAATEDPAAETDAATVDSRESEQDAIAGVSSADPDAGSEVPTAEPEAVSDTPIAESDPAAEKPAVDPAASLQAATAQLFAGDGTLAAAAATATGCNYANSGTGAYADTLCWLDFSNTDGTAITGPVSNKTLTVQLQGGYTLTTRLDVTGGAVAGRRFPTYSAAFLGNNNFYTGVGGRPALYQTSGGVTTVSLSDITLTHGGTKITGFSLVTADAESTDAGEWITWSRTGGTPFSWLPNTPGSTTQLGTIGNACGQSVTPAVGTTGDTASCYANADRYKSGTAMLMLSPSNTTDSFNVTAQMRGGGLQALAFGVITARAQVTVQVADRIVGAGGTTLDATNFAATMTGAPTVSTGTTGTTATSGGLPVLVAAGGTPVTFTTSRSPASGIAADYTASWQCSRTNPNSTTPTLWPTSGSSPTPPTPEPVATVGAGQFLQCTVTYTPPYLTLVKNVVNGQTGATNTSADWTLTGTGPSLATGAGTGKKTAVAAGTYALTETGPANGWVHGYDWTGLACAANTGSTTGWALTTSPGSTTGTTVGGGSVRLVAGNNITCTYTNTAYPPTTLTLNLKTGVADAAAPTSWTLDAAAPTGALPGPHGVTGSTTVDHVAVSPASSYQLSAAGGPVRYVPTGWLCVDQTGATVTVSTTGAVALTRGTQATCTISFATAHITLLKHVVTPAAGFAADAWTITGTPQPLTGLDVIHAVGAENASATNTFEVLPGHGYTLTEALTDPASTLAYRQLSLQRLENGAWVDVASAQITAPAVGGSATYRFVNDRPPAITLPLTGGASTDAFTIAGSALLMVAVLALGLTWRRRRTHLSA